MIANLEDVVNQSFDYIIVGASPGYYVFILMKLTDVV